MCLRHYTKHSTIALSRKCEGIVYVQGPRVSLVCFVYCSENYGTAGAVRTPGQHGDLDMRCVGALLPWNATSPRRRLVPLRPSCLYTGTAMTLGESHSDLFPT